MSHKVEEPKPILPSQARWEPTADPTSINVPGLDTKASVNDQIDQIEQLITIKLQNIDANFSKMQQIMSSRLLPAFKRYSVGTEPVREAAKFWTSFYEQAAQVRIPTYEDYSTMHDQSSHPEAEEIHETEADVTGSSDRSSASSSSRHPSGFDPSRLPSEESFLPGQAAVSSTPARARYRRQNPRDSFTPQGSEPSWTASLESPMVRLDLDLQDFAREDQQPVSDSIIDDSSAFDETVDATVHAQSSHANETYTEPLTPSPDKGKARQQQSLRHDVLRSTMESGAGGRSRGPVSPLKFRQKPKTPIPATQNPYLPAGTKPQEWSGVVDLRDPTVTTPQRPTAASRTFRPATPPASTYRAAQDDDDDDDDDFGLPPGMSPPVMIDMARLPTLGRTPSKEAAARIGRDLVGDARRGGPGVALSTAWERARRGLGGESSLSSAPTPPSLSRYTKNAYPDSASGSVVADSTLDSMFQRVGLMGYQQPPASSASGASAAHASAHTPSFAHSDLHSYTKEPSPTIQPLRPHIPVSTSLQTPEQPQARYDLYQLDDSQLAAGGADEGDFSSDSLDDDDDDIVNNTANPSAAFLLAAQRDADGSFGSSNTSSDSLDDDPDSGHVPAHPFAHASVEDSYDDSFDDADEGAGGVEEETVFGVPPAERAARARRSVAPGGGLRILGEDPLADTIGLQVAMHGGVVESPTPWIGQSQRPG